MKKILSLIITAIIINTFACDVYAQSQYGAALGKIENILYGFQYNDEDDTTRINRIEKTVYGKSTNKNNTQKLADLKKHLSTDLLGQEITPKEDTFAEESDSYKEETLAQNAPSTGPGVDYPAINELEKQLFKQEFKTQDLNTRLANLEKKSMGKTFPSDDFSTRVDRLRAEIKPKSLMDNAIAQSSNEYFDDDPIELEKNYNLDRYESPNRFDYDEYNARNKARANNSSLAKNVNLASVEKSIFRKSFQNDSLESRLTRLESTMFGTSFTNDSNEDRMRRISSAYRATKSAGKYDSNKFSQNAMTAVQIGTLILMVLACIL